jgi:heterodisulfide reductase subunit A-like polyferredoxin
MAQGRAASQGKPPDEFIETEFVIVGGGICGILAAKQCSKRQWPYVMIERNPELGGVWSTLANRHSYLQVGLAHKDIFMLHLCCCLLRLRVNLTPL